MGRLTVAASLVAVMLPPAALAGGATATTPDLGAVHSGRLALGIAFAGLVFALPILVIVVGGLFTGFKGAHKLFPGPLLRGILVGGDKRVSTSKTVSFVWTYSVAAALLSLVIAKWLGHGDALAAQSAKGLQSNYALLVGGPLGAAILAKVIVTSQIAAGTASKPAADQTDASQLLTGDANTTDLGDVQYVLFNVVALVFFFGELLQSPTAGLPDLPDLLVGLTSVSAVGYLGKKVIVQSPAILSLAPTSPKPGDTLRIYGPGLVVEGNPPREVTFDDVAVTEGLAVELTPDGPAVRVKVPADLAPGPHRLAVKTAKELVITSADGVVVAPLGPDAGPSGPPVESDDVPPPAPPTPSDSEPPDGSGTVPPEADGGDVPDERR